MSDKIKVRQCYFCYYLYNCIISNVSLSNQKSLKLSSRRAFDEFHKKITLQCDSKIIERDNMINTMMYG